MKFEFPTPTPVSPEGPEGPEGPTGPIGPTADDWVTPSSYGLIADGSSHPLSTRYATLAEAQAAFDGAYFFVTALTQEIDWAACKAASNAAFGADLEYIIGDYTPVTATSDGTTIQDNTQSWIPLVGTGTSEFRGEHRHKELYRKKLDGSIDHSLILSNTANTLTLGSGGTATDYGTPAALSGGPVVLTDQYAILFAVVSAASSATQIVDTTQSWTVDEHVGKVAFRRFHSNGFTDSAPVASNTSDTLTLASALPSGVVGATNSYTLGYGENGSASQQLNKSLWLPRGRYRFGAGTWRIRNLVGARIQGSGERATVLTGNATILAFDGLWYTHISDFSIECATTTATAAMEIDGNIPGHPYDTRGVQAVSLANMLINGGGSLYGLTMTRLGSSAAQGSECTYSKLHISNASFACYYQNGFNALQNQFFGGNFQSYPKNGIYVIGGTVNVYGVGFQSVNGYEQIVNDGWDIDIGASGAYGAITISGCRSESLRFLRNQGAVIPFVTACDIRPAVSGWFASTNYSLGSNQGRAIVEGTTLWVATTEGTSGTVEPDWTLPGPHADGGVVWTKTPFDAIFNASGHIDRRTIKMYPGTIRAAFEDRYIRVTSDFVYANRADQTLYPNVIFVDATAGPVNVTLPTGSGVAIGGGYGRRILVKKVDASANAVTVATADLAFNPAGSIVLAGGSRGWVDLFAAEGVGGGPQWQIVGQGP